MLLKSLGLLKFLLFVVAMGGVLGFLFTLGFNDKVKKWKRWMFFSLAITAASLVSIHAVSDYQDKIQTVSDKTIQELPVKKMNISDVAFIPEYHTEAKGQSPTATGRVFVVAIYRDSKTGKTEQTGTRSLDSLVYDLPSGAKPYMVYSYLNKGINGYNPGMYNVKIHVPVDYKVKN